MENGAALQRISFKCLVELTANGLRRSCKRSTQSTCGHLVVKRSLRVPMPRPAAELAATIPMIESPDVRSFIQAIHCSLRLWHDGANSVWYS